MSEPCVISVLLNTNRREDTLACLASLQEATCPNHRILVLDNQSSDGSPEAIRASFPGVQIHALAENRGYAGNNNVGIHLALDQGADWIFVLNEDTIVAPECIEKLIEVGKSDPKIGMVGPMVYHHDEPNVIQSAGGIMTRTWEALHVGKNEKDVGQFTAPRSMDWLTGCSLCVRRAVVENVGALDERFFYYFEETEWCLRARKEGWRLVHVPQARVWHKGVQRLYEPSPSVTYYATRNHLLLMAKHHAPPLAWIVGVAQILRTLITYSVRPRWRSRRDHRNAMLQGLLDFLGRRWGCRVVP